MNERGAVWHGHAFAGETPTSVVAEADGWTPQELTMGPRGHDGREIRAIYDLGPEAVIALVQRLLAQIERILRINDLHAVTKEAAEAAREGLIIGVT